MSTAHVTDLGSMIAARKRFAAPIKAHLAIAGISGAELARRINLDQSQVSRRLSGHLPFDTDELRLVADQLNITVVELIQMPTEKHISGGRQLVGVGTGIHRSITGVSRLGDVTAL